MQINQVYSNQSRFAELLSRMRCVECGGTLTLSRSAFTCSTCGKSHMVADGVGHFVPTENYASSFGFQWNKYRRTQLDTDQMHFSEEAFRSRTGLKPEQLRAKWILDVGCGMGRFAEVASRWGANVVGVDLTRAALVAAENLAMRDNAFFFRADLFNLPFAPESFDFIYSIGVLHHTPDCEAAFKALPVFLAPGGTIAIWLYSGYNRWYRASDFYRRYTSVMKPGTLHALCQLAGPIYELQQSLKKIPWVGAQVRGLLQYVFPISQFPVREWRVLDTFDWYSPTYQSKHTYEEVFRWFEDVGLVDLHVGKEPIAVRGTKAGAVTSNSREQKAKAIERAGT